jgi:branched-subunit amino acid aminotransferase/4-amino-4-deoxychorismate lyase
MSALPDTLCYLNGDFTPVCEAKVSVLDRGFIFGDGIYEVVPVYGQRLFRFDEHMARLERSLGKLRIHNPHRPRGAGCSAAATLVRALAQSEHAEDQLVYIQITRGVAPRDHVMPAGITPTVFMMVTRDETALGRAAPPRRGLCDGARLPLGARRHQEHLAARQCAGTADVRPTTTRWRPSCSATAT